MDQKILKEKHVTINLNNAEYETIKKEADIQSRTLTAYCYLVIKKHLEGLKNE